MNSQTELICISGCENLERIGDVIFVHGLRGDARGTWHPKGKRDDNNSWPTWLGGDLPEVGVWSLKYEVEPFRWKGNTMPLVDRAINTLAILDSYGIGERPLVFITHSMGGLLVKQMLRHALDFGTPEWKAIAEQTKGIVFLSTPHSGSDIASWIQYIGKVLHTSVSVEELQANHSRLRELNLLYRNHEQLRQVGMQVYCEKQTTSGFLVVDETSADPGIPGVVPIPVDCDHISICRPESRQSFVYRRVQRFVRDCLRTRQPTEQSIALEQPQGLNQDQVNILKAIANGQSSDEQISETLSLDINLVRYYLEEMETRRFLKGIKTSTVFETDGGEYFNCSLTSKGQVALKNPGALIEKNGSRIISTGGGNYNERIEGNYIQSNYVVNSNDSGENYQS